MLKYTIKFLVLLLLMSCLNLYGENNNNLMQNISTIGAKDIQVSDNFFL